MKLSLVLPIVPSVNHCYRNITVNRRILTKRGQLWRDEVILIAKSQARVQKWVYSSGQKLVMELRAYWPDKRRRDMSNMHKLLPDVLEGILYEDDRWLLIRDMDFEVDKAKPRVEIQLYRLSEKDSNKSPIQQAAEVAARTTVKEAVESAEKIIRGRACQECKATSCYESCPTYLTQSDRSELMKWFGKTSPRHYFK